MYKKNQYYEINKLHCFFSIADMRCR